MVPSSSPCLLRVREQCWRCSLCGAVFFSENDSVFHLLWLFRLHLRREHRAELAAAPKRVA